jgi:hypothetical protein
MAQAKRPANTSANCKGQVASRRASTGRWPTIRRLKPARRPNAIVIATEGDGNKLARRQSQPLLHRAVTPRSADGPAAADANHEPSKVLKEKHGPGELVLVTGVLNMQCAK